MISKILVWDLPVRIIHWSVAFCFLGLMLTGETERLRDIHIFLGYTLAALMLMRLIWGFTGSKYARFSEFVRPLSTVLVYLKSLFSLRPAHYVGHNPAGALVILGLLALGLAASASGVLLQYEVIDIDSIEELHEILSYIMLSLVFVHIFGVFVSSFIHKEKLILAMITGRKNGADQSLAIKSANPLFALFIVVVIFGFAFFYFGYASVTNVADKLLTPSAEQRESARDED